MKRLLILLLGFSFLKGQAQAPQQINYQGVARNSVGSVIANQNISVRLSIRDGSPSGAVVYRESRTLRTNSFGLFVTAIGSPGATSTTGSLGAVSWASSIKFLQVEMDPTGASNYIDMGTSQLLSVPYAMYATTAGGAVPVGNAGGDLTGEYPTPIIKNGAITNSKIGDGEISINKLQAGLIPTSLPPNGAAGGDLTGVYPNPVLKTGIVNNTKLADNSVTTSKIQNGSVTAIKLAPGIIPTSLPPMGDAGGDLTGTYPNPTIGTGVITGSKIATATITADKLAPGVIPTSLPVNGTAGGDLTGSYPNPVIAAAAIDNTKLADNSVTTSKLVDGTITASKLAAGVLPTSLPPNGTAGGDLSGSYPNPAVNKLQGIAVSNTVPSNGQVLKFNGTSWVPGTDNTGIIGGTAGGDLNGTYPNPLINASAIDNTKLADNSVSTLKVQDGAITASKLAAGLIPTSLTPSGAAGGDLIGTYPNPTINASAIDNSKLADNSVSTSKVQDASITSAKLAPGVIPTSLAPSGAAGGDLNGNYPNPIVADNAITTTKILDGSVTVNKLAAGVIPTTLPPNGPAGGDLSGTYPNPAVANNAITSQKLADGSVTTTKIGDNQISTSKIQDGAITASKLDPSLLIVGGGGSPTGAAGGDLSGNYPNPVVAANAITTTKIADGSVTASKLAAGLIPTSLPPIGTAGGDLNGNYPNPTVNKLQGVAIGTTAPAAGQVLKFDGTSWVPSTDNVATFGSNAGGDLSGTYPNPNIASGAVTTPKIANGAVNTPKIADGAVTLNKLAAGVIPTTLPPSGTAGGDLSGTYPNPAVNKIQGIGVSTTAPAVGQVLKFDGTSWVPAADNTGVIGGAAGGDLTGTYPNPTINSLAVTSGKLADNSVTTTKILDGSVTTSKLAAGVIPTALPPTGTAGGDLTGTYPNPTINALAVNNSKLADNSVSTTKVQDASITAAKLAPGVIPTTLAPSGAAGGDLSGNYPNPSVNKIQGITVTNTAPTNGQVLTFNGTQWVPSTPASSSLSLPYMSAVNSPSNLFSLTNSGSGAALEGINSTSSSNVSGVIGTISINTPGTMSAGVKGINMGAGSNGIGVYGVHAGGGYGVYGSSASGVGVYGYSPSGNAVMGNSTTGNAIYGESSGGNAGAFYVSNATNSNDALFVNNFGQGNAITSLSDQSNGIFAATNSASAVGVQAMNNGNGGLGLWGVSTLGAGIGVKGTSADNGGTAIVGELQGVTSGDLAAFKVDGVNKARIDINGKGYFNGGTQNSGADVAETFDVEGSRSQYEPGDVLIISQATDRTVEKCQTPYSTLVAGVYATKPGVLLTEKDASGNQLDAMVPMGVIGVIPTKVCLEGGAIKRGDLLVTSSTPGAAMKADPEKVRIGQVIGKALEDYNATGIGKIKVLVSIK